MNYTQPDVDAAGLQHLTQQMPREDAILAAFNLGHGLGFVSGAAYYNSTAPARRWVGFAIGVAVGGAATLILGG